MSLLTTGNSHVSRHYLLVPPEATPNGPLHLGHIGGPFLCSDMIARHLRVRGDLPLVITGSDVYESYVTIKAHAQDTTPGEVAARYGRRIQDDLAAMRIGVDAFVSPDQEPWRELFEQEVAASIERLRGRGAVVTRTERVPYCADSDRWVVGGWLLGRCPECGAGVSSYFCEECSAHFLPESVVEPRPLLDEGPLTWREIRSLFLRVPDGDVLDATLAGLGLDESHRRTVARYLERNGSTVRLSAPQTWGVPLSVAPAADVPHALFPYAGIFMFARLAGAVHGRLSGTGVNAFDPGSGVTTVTTLGIDNVIPTLVSIVGTSLLHGDMKPYDRCLINHFYQLAGRKFSTSARHAIWAADVAAGPAIDVDVVRYFLARAELESGPASFETAEFLTTANTLADDLGKRMEAAWSRLPDGRPCAPAPAAVALLDSLLSEQSAALDTTRVSTRRAVDALDRWWTDEAVAHTADDGAYWWLKGLALLASPVMPDLAERIWQALGGTGEPRTGGFLVPTAVQRHLLAPGFPRVNAADLNACLPDTLRSEGDA